MNLTIHTVKAVPIITFFLNENYKNYPEIGAALRYVL